MGDKLEEVLADAKRLPLSSEQAKVVHQIFVNGAREAGLISKKEAKKEMKNGG